MKYLKIKSLEKGWCDCDELTLHAAFQCLVSFVEKELTPDNPFKPDWGFTEESKHAYKEIKDLYRWWIKKRPARKNPIDRKGLKIPPIEAKDVPGSPDLVELIQPDPKKYRGWYRAVEKAKELEILWYEEDQKNLHRLVNIRSHLWT
jgi:hypothetical protein